MTAIFYDWLGFNEWLFNAIYRLNVPQLDAAWRILAYGYSFWMVASVALLISMRYLKIRHSASESQLAIMSDIMAVLILSFSLVWCVVYTAQTVTLWPGPWVLYPDVVPLQSPLLWHEGFPASAPSLAMMVSCLFWRYARGTQKTALAAYVVSACLLSIASGQNWPVDVVAGLIIGAWGVRLARLYYQFGIRLAGS